MKVNFLYYSSFNLPGTINLKLSDINPVMRKNATFFTFFKILKMYY